MNEEKIRAANKAAADLRAAQEKAIKDKEAAEAKAKALEVVEKGLTIEYSEAEEPDEEYCIIKHNGVVIKEVPVWCGDPEDASLYRAYSWVLPLLEKVYQLGLEDGAKLGGEK
jgi:hypothetical protein